MQMEGEECLDKPFSPHFWYSHDERAAFGHLVKDYC